MGTPGFEWYDDREVLGFRPEDVVSDSEYQRLRRIHDLTQLRPISEWFSPLEELQVLRELLPPEPS